MFNYSMSGKSVIYKTEWYCVLIDWVVGAQRGPCFMTESQIFSRPAQPNSVNKQFIIWPLTVENFDQNRTR